MKKFLLLTIILCGLSFRVSGSFRSDMVSPRALAMGESVCALGDDVSTIFYNPAAVGMLNYNSFLKANFGFMNKYGVSQYNLYAGNMVLTGINLKLGFSYKYEGVSDIMEETIYKFSYGNKFSPAKFLKKIFPGYSIAFGISLNRYTISASGYQFAANDSAIKDKSVWGSDFSVVFITSIFNFSFVLRDIIFGDDISINKRYKFGLVFKFIEKYNTRLTFEFEPVKSIGLANDSWIEIGSFKIGKGYYPVLNIGIEKIFKNIFSLRVGLKDFNITGGVGLYIKNNITADYAILNNSFGTTHSLGITIW